MITTIAFDADDTLWHTERIFISTKEKYTRLLSEFAEKSFIEQNLDATETENIKHFGYGVKGFTLSMIETACQLTEGRITDTVVSPSEQRATASQRTCWKRATTPERCRN